MLGIAWDGMVWCCRVVASSFVWYGLGLIWCRGEGGDRVCFRELVAVLRWLVHRSWGVCGRALL